MRNIRSVVVLITLAVLVAVGTSAFVLKRHHSVDTSLKVKPICPGGVCNQFTEVVVVGCFELIFDDDFSRAAFFLGQYVDVESAYFGLGLE